MIDNYIGNLTRIEFEKAIQQSKGVIIVCGSTEQHGIHLPLDTDNILGFETAMAVAKKTNCLVMPPINYGQIFSASNFNGTFGLSNDTLKRVIKELTVALIKQGAKNVIYLTCHGGNKNYMQEAARELLKENGYENVWYFSSEKTAEMKDLMEDKVSKTTHAGEGETSEILYFREELVKKDLMQDVYPEWPEDNKYRPITWDKFNSVGSFGYISSASAEKGEKFFNMRVNHLADLINRLIKD